MTDKQEDAALKALDIKEGKCQFMSRRAYPCQFLPRFFKSVIVKKPYKRMREHHGTGTTRK